MSTNPQAPSAKILPFARKSPARPGGAGRETRAMRDERLRAFATVEFGSGWYHEAAIQAEGALKP
jgi:uncharacterized protein DUF2735